MISILKTLFLTSGFGTKLIDGLVKTFSRSRDLKELKELNLAQWENYAIRASQTSWKDEFWTLIIGFPFILRMLGVMIQWIFGNPTLANAASAMMTDIDAMLGGNYFVVTMTCISASFGIRMRDKMANSKAVNGPPVKPKSKRSEAHERR